VQDVPIGGVTGAFLRNWQINGITTMTSGLPVNVIVGFNRSRNGHDARIDRPDLVAGGNANPVLGGPNLYFDPSQFALQPAGFLGNLGANTLIGPGFVTFDLSVVRQVPLTDRYRLQVRLEGFNLFNHPNFGLPDTAIFNSNGTVRGAAGRITTSSSAMRQMQLGIRLTF
jgi:hypothetical protein